MKKIFIFIISVVALSTAVAQDVRSLNAMSGGQNIFTKATQAIDSIKFVNGNAVVHYGVNTWSRSMSSIDSVIFGWQQAIDDIEREDSVAIDTANAIRIVWNGNDVTIINPRAAAGVSIVADSAHVTVTSTANISDLVYILSGSSDNGSLTINTDKKLIALLNGVSLTNPQSAALLISGDKRACIHLQANTVNALTDGAASTQKGALQSDGRFIIQGSGQLNINGIAKHGIQSSGSTTVLDGDIQIHSAAKDGMNVDNFIMWGGAITVSGADGDCIDGDQGYILIKGGTLNLTSTAKKASALVCDSVMQLFGGNITINLSGKDTKALKGGMDIYVTDGTTHITVSGDQSKAIKCSGDFYMMGGMLDITASGNVVLEESGSGYDPSYCTGIKTDGNITITDGSLTVICPESNNGGKALSASGDITIAGGTLNLTTIGGAAVYTNADGAQDDYKPSCIKADGNISIFGGSITATSTGTNIATDANLYIDAPVCDSIVLNNSGIGFTYSGTGTSVTDGFAPSCINVDGNLEIYGANITATATGRGGRGIVVDGTYTQGLLNADNDNIHIHVYTSGAPVNTTNSGGGGHGPGSQVDYWKGLPKGVKIEDTLTINSGYISVYCSQSSGDPNGEAIETKSAMYVNGGVIEANSYDDAINVGTYMEVNDGFIWAYARGNDGIDNNGNYTYLNGGVIVVQSGSEQGIDASADAGGHLIINGATIVALGGAMGALDSPTFPGSQKNLSLSNVTPANGFAIYKNDQLIVAFKSSTTNTGSNFQNTPSRAGTKPPGGGGTQYGRIAVTTPDITSGTYSVYSTVTISGGTNWHGLYNGATVTTSGNATSVTASSK